MIFETHAHYDDERFNEDREELLASLPEKGVDRVMNIGASFAGCEHSIALAERYPHVYAAIGIHPENIEDVTEENLNWIREKSAWEKTAAIGEIGLDYYWYKEAEVQQAQRDAFRVQMELARTVGLPVVVHSRDAAEDTLRILKEVHEKDISENRLCDGALPGVIHCYSYSKEMAREFIKLGYYIGVGGVVTFKNAKKLKETVADIGIEHILLETDCPYMAPEPHRGSRNDSTYIPYVVNVIAELANHTAEEVIEVTRQNALRLFPKVQP